MIYSVFLDLVKEKCCYNTDDPYNMRDSYGKQNNEKVDCIYKDWRIGGMTGGSCWGTSADQSVSAEDESDYSGLDALFEEVCPNLTFLHYRKILALQETFEYTVSEYYGNYYEYKRAIISIRALYELLSELKYV